MLASEDMIGYSDDEGMKERGICVVIISESKKIIYPVWTHVYE